MNDLYWLVYNSTITIFTLCTPLLAHGYASVVVEFLIFAALCMEAQVIAPTHLILVVLQRQPRYCQKNLQPLQNPWY